MSIILPVVLAFLLFKILKELAVISMYTVIIRSSDTDAEAKKNNGILRMVMKAID